MKCRLLRSESCRLGNEVWFRTRWFVFRYSTQAVMWEAPAVGSGRGRYKSWLDSRRLHPDEPLNKQRVRAADNIQAIYRFPWGCVSLLRLWLLITGSAAALWERCQGILESLCRCFPNSGGLIVAQLFTQEHQEICQGETWWLGWVCSWQHLANDARHHRHQGIRHSRRPPVWSKHTGMCVSLSAKRNKEKRPCFTHGMCGFFCGQQTRDCVLGSQSHHKEVWSASETAFVLAQSAHIQMWFNAKWLTFLQAIPQWSFLNNQCRSPQCITVAESLKVARLPSDSSSSLSWY